MSTSDIKCLMIGMFSAGMSFVLLRGLYDVMKEFVRKHPDSPEAKYPIAVSCVLWLIKPLKKGSS